MAPIITTAGRMAVINWKEASGGPVRVLRKNKRKPRQPVSSNPQALQPKPDQWGYVTIGWPEAMRVAWSDDPKAAMPANAWLVPAGTSWTTRPKGKWLLARPARVKRRPAGLRDSDFLYCSDTDLSERHGFDTLIRMPTGRWVIDDLYGAAQRKGHGR